MKSFYFVGVDKSTVKKEINNFILKKTTQNTKYVYQ